jgi:CRP-like cAMP-binding protein
MDVLERARALAATGVLGEVAAPTLIALAERATARELDAGAGSSTRRADGAVVIVVVRGALDDGGGTRHGPGALLGAAGALDGAAPAAVVRAVEASVVLELGQDDFVDVLAEHPAAARALARALAIELREGRR